MDSFNLYKSFILFRVCAKTWLRKMLVSGLKRSKRTTCSLNAGGKGPVNRAHLAIFAYVNAELELRAEDILLGLCFHLCSCREELLASWRFILWCVSPKLFWRSYVVMASLTGLMYSAASKIFDIKIQALLGVTPP